MGILSLIILLVIIAIVIFSISKSKDKLSNIKTNQKNNIMKCKECNTENEIGAKYCRKCGAELETTKPSPIERFPEYKFKPTSVYKLKGKLQNRIFVNLIVGIILLGCTIGLIYCMVEGHLDFISLYNDYPQESYKWYEEEIKGARVLTPIIILLTIILIINYIKYGRARDLSSVADYFQSSATTKRYLFVVKAGKIGVYDRNSNKVVVPCEYDSLQWMYYSKVLTAVKGSRQFNIDINGNPLK